MQYRQIWPAGVLGGILTRAFWCVTESVRRASFGQQVCLKDTGPVAANKEVVVNRRNSRRAIRLFMDVRLIEG